MRRYLPVLALLLGACNQPPAAPDPTPAVAEPEPLAPAPARPVPENPQIAPMTEKWSKVDDAVANATMKRVAAEAHKSDFEWRHLRPFVGDELCYGEGDSDATEEGLHSSLRCARGAAVDEAAEVMVGMVRGATQLSCAASECVSSGQGLESWFALRARHGRVYLVGVFERDLESTDDRAWGRTDQHVAWRAAVAARFGR